MNERVGENHYLEIGHANSSKLVLMIIVQLQCKNKKQNILRAISNYWLLWWRQRTESESKQTIFIQKYNFCSNNQQKQRWMNEVRGNKIMFSKLNCLILNIWILWTLTLNSSNNYSL